MWNVKEALIKVCKNENTKGLILITMLGSIIMYIVSLDKVNDIERFITIHCMTSVIVCLGGVIVSIDRYNRSTIR